MRWITLACALSAVGCDDTPVVGADLAGTEMDMSVAGGDMPAGGSDMTGSNDMSSPVIGTKFVSFAPGVGYGANMVPFGVVVADFTSDTKLDVAVANLQSNDV